MASKKTPASKKPSAPKPEPMDPYYACQLMHTALRKLCDSAITSAMYNVIQLVEVEPEEMNAWVTYGKLVAQQVNAGIKKTQACKAAMAGLLATVEDHFFKDRSKEPPKDARSALYAIHSILRCFGEGDWIGMAGFLSDDAD